MKEETDFINVGIYFLSLKRDDFSIFIVIFFPKNNPQSLKKLILARIEENEAINHYLNWVISLFSNLYYLKMKNYILLFFLAAFHFCTLQAQADQATEIKDWTRTYQFDEVQTAELETIVARKYRNLEELKTIETNDPVLYKRKRQGILKQTKAQVRRMMNVEQMTAFDEQEGQRKADIKVKAKEMSKNGADKAEIAKLLEELNY